MPELTAVSLAPPSATASAPAPAPSGAPAGSAPAHAFGTLLRGLTSGASGGKGKRGNDDTPSASTQPLAPPAPLSAPALSQAGQPTAADDGAQDAAPGSAPRGSAVASSAAGAAPVAPPDPAASLVSPFAAPPTAAAQRPTVATPSKPPPVAASTGADTPVASAPTSQSSAPAPDLSAPAPAADAPSALVADGVGSQATADVPAAGTAWPASVAGTERAAADARSPLVNGTAQGTQAYATSFSPSALPGVTITWLDAGARTATPQPQQTSAPAAPSPASLLAGRNVFVRRAGGDDASIALNLTPPGAPAAHPVQTGSQTWAAPASPPAKSDTPPAPSGNGAHADGVAAGAPSQTAAASSAQPGSADGGDAGSTGSDTGTRGAFGTRATSSATFGLDAPAALDTGNLAASLALTIRSGVSEARLQLRPAGLGEVHVQIISGREGIALRLSAENTTAGDLLRAHAGELRDALAAHGLSVTDLHVLPNQPAPPSNNNGGPTWQDGGRRAGRDPQDGSGGDAPPRDEDDNDGQGG